MLRKHIDNVISFFKKAGQYVADKFEIPDENSRLLRAKLVMEEALEMCVGLGVDVSPKSLIGENINTSKDLDFCISKTNQFDAVAVMDAAIDLLWVGVTGPAVMMGLSDKLESCIEEVDKNNLDKFLNGYKCEITGKWIKDKNHEPPNLKEIIFSENKSRS